MRESVITNTVGRSPEIRPGNPQLPVFTDGSTAPVDLSFSDWTLGGASGMPAFGNLVVAKTDHRNEGGGGQDPVATYMLATAPVTIPAGRQVAAVTLPNNPDIHVFAVAAG